MPSSCTTKQQIRRRLSSWRPSVVTMAATANLWREVTTSRLRDDVRCELAAETQTPPAPAYPGCTGPDFRKRKKTDRKTAVVFIRARCEQVQVSVLVLTPMAKPMNRFAVCSDPRAERPKDRKDDQGRNDRVVQIGPDGLAA